MEETFDRKKHWENIYKTKQLNEVSWYQPVPVTSLQLIEKLNIPLNAAIIDVGGGDSFLVDNLLDLGYTNITVLDISEAAIERAKNRLGNRANSVQWIVADAANFVPPHAYDLWHDRAAFHFLTAPKEIENYVNTAHQFIKPGGVLIVGTFSESGPLKCSGIVIKQYTEDAMKQVFANKFEPLGCETFDHTTPFNTTQNFLFCTFSRR